LFFLEAAGILEIMAVVQQLSIRRDRLVFLQAGSRQQQLNLVDRIEIQFFTQRNQLVNRPMRATGAADQTRDICPTFVQASGQFFLLDALTRHVPLHQLTPRLIGDTDVHGFPSPWFTADRLLGTTTPVLTVTVSPHTSPPWNTLAPRCMWPALLDG